MQKITKKVKGRSRSFYQLKCDCGKMFEVKVDNYKRNPSALCKQCRGWTSEKLRKLAKNCTDRSEFNNTGNALKAAKRLGMIDEIRSILPASDSAGNNQLTHKDYLTKVKMNRGAAITVLGIYVNNYTKIKVKHKCGYIWDVLPRGVLNKKDCPNCCTVKSDSNMLYMWRVPTTNIVKIGVTSVRLGTRRINEVVAQYNTVYKTNIKPEILYTKETSNALEIEKYLHRKFTNRSNMDKYITGFTEFRLMTDLEISTAIAYISSQRE